MPPLPPERDADDPDFLEPPDEVLRDEVEALFAADRLRPAPDFDAPALFFADDFAPDFDAPPRADERAVLFDAAPFEAVLLFVAPDFAALFFAPDFAALFLALEPELFALDFLLEPVELEPDLRDFVELSAITRLLSAFA
jgi:hypothetical protein